MDVHVKKLRDSFDNRLYQASDILEINNRQRHNRVSRNQALSSSQIHTDEGYSGVNGESVQNRRYYASEIPDISNKQGHNRISRNQALASSHTDEGYKGVSATVPATETTHTRRTNLSQNVDSQINGRNMHYAEVSFEVLHPTHRFVIHGNDDRTVYSEIDHSIRAEPLPSSSSESEDD
ncbi:uncharacterized protein [Mytilus edulis]|uniref:uncharacterized protein n=1 Tax=Mytilus edulis TaxID=6550 RepID=UPI0039F04F84